MSLPDVRHEVLEAIERFGIGGATPDEIADYLELGVTHVERALGHLVLRGKVCEGHGRDDRPLSRRRKFNRGDPALMDSRLPVLFTPETWERAKI